jgi:regulator of replication initiation timing
MKDMIMEIVASYENGISMSDWLISNAHDAVATFDENWQELGKERARLKVGLQEILARNRSLRRKDFDHHIECFLLDCDRKRTGIEQEQKQLKQMLKGYLDEQKRLVASLRERIGSFNPGDVDRAALEAVIAELKKAYQDKGERVTVALREFQCRLNTFRQEQEEINHRLERLVQRGESLRLEDLRQLQAGHAREERKAGRELRRQEVQRLLAHFGQQRRGVGRHRRY